MKKILLPITTAIALSGFATPLLVSCNKPNKFNYEYDLTKPFNSQATISPMGGELSAQDATQTYLLNAKNNHQIVADDLAHSWIDGGIAALSQANKLTFSSVNIETQNNLMDISFSYDAKDPQGTEKKYSADITLKNIPILVSYGEIPEIGNVWGLQPDFGENPYDFLLSNDSWKYTQIDRLEGEEPLTHDWDKQKLLNDPEQETDKVLVYVAICTSIPGLSYFLSETTPK